MRDQMQVIDNSQEKINQAFAQADHIIMRKYMPELCNYPIKRAGSEIENTNINSVLRLNKIEKIVYDADENNLDKLMNVYNSVALCGGSIIHIIYSDGEKVEYYIGTRCNNMNEVAVCQSALTGTFEGNFPGSRMVRQEKKELTSCIEKVFSSDIREQSRIVSVVSGIPGFRSEDNKEFVQGMEKLIDSIGDKKYALITIADPVSIEKLTEIKESYENLYSQLSPFSKVTLSYSESDSNALAESISDSITASVGNTISNTTNQSTTTNTGSNTSNGLSLIFASRNKAVSYGEATQSGTSYGDSQSKTRGITRTTGTTDTHTTTTGNTLQLVKDNKCVNDLLQKIERQIERIEDARDTGLWSTATYCIADNVQTSKTLASTLQSLCRSKKSSIESYSINTWTDPYKLKNIESYLKKMIHPKFEMNAGCKQIEITPASMISGSELVITAGLPQKAVSGVPISKMVAFARNITIEDEISQEEKNISIGKIYHMGKVEQTNVKLNLESLSSHMMITGSTGSGKSNTVYTMISELKRNNIKFLVVEPAKGEYKHIFGNDSDVNVFGTNEKFTELLRINPFSFPDDIHVLEHVDRLIEIFNVCWPMYAAMPAVLKDAILQSYLKCGWNLETSENIYGIRYYPTCRDLQRQIERVINSSAYSDEVKGNYIGSLATRINSLTNGINGQMFTTNEINAHVLFDESTIIDLSRVGSQETKSLIMGIIVTKLNEYRMAEANGCMNQRIRHITVLEEAHNLLRNTHGNTTSAEGADMIGKSVEMISNSIAEMRTYGEGFIIVDQSPSAIDISAIRNTNTKVLMRLPEENDRQQAGKAAAMNDKQIPELAKLPKGVAVIYQNNWLDPVLCKISKANVEEQAYILENSEKEDLDEKNVRRMMAMLLVGNRMDECLDISTDVIRNSIDNINISTETKIVVLKTLEMLEQGKEPSILEEDSFSNLSEIVCEIINYDNLKHAITGVNDAKEIQNQIHFGLLNVIGSISVELEYAIAQCVLRRLVTEHDEKTELYARWREYAIEQRKKVGLCQ